MYQQQQQQQHLQWEPTMAFHWIGHSVPQITFSSLQSIANRKYPRYCTHWILQLLHHSFITNLKRETTTTTLLARSMSQPQKIDQSMFVFCFLSVAALVVLSCLFSYIYSQDGTDLVIRKMECSTSPESSGGVIEGTRRQTERIVAKNEPADVVVRPILCSTWSHYTAASGIFASIFRVNNNNSLKENFKKEKTRSPPLASSYVHWPFFKCTRLFFRREGFFFILRECL